MLDDALYRVEDGQDRRVARTRALHNPARARKAPWTSTAFIVESVLLLLFLAGSLAVLAQAFTLSLTHSAEGRTTDAAVAAATSVAERFAVDPASVAETTQVGNLVVVCTTTTSEREAGTMHYAHIDVYAADAATGSGGATSAAGAVSASPSEPDDAADEPVFSLDTSSYQREER